MGNIELESSKAYVKGEGKNTYVYFKEFNDFYYDSQRENVFTKSQLLEMLE